MPDNQPQPHISPFSVLLLILALAFAIALHAWLGMDAFFDTANYHFYIGWAALELAPYAHGAVAQYHTYFNPLLDVINYLLFQLHPYAGAAYHAVAFVLLQVAAYLIAQKAISSENRLLSELRILGAVAIGATGAMTISLFGSFTNEHLTALLILWSLWHCMMFLEKGLTSHLVIAGLLGGLAVGFKLTAAPFFACLMLSLLLVSGFSVRAVWICGVFSIFGYLLIDGPFLVLRWQESGNPLFPFANNLFKSPLAPDQWLSFSTFHASELFDHLLLPLRWLSSGIYSEVETVRDGRLLLAHIGLLAFAGSLLISQKKPSRAQLLLVLFFLLSWLSWIIVFRIYRYLIVLEAISGIIFAMGLMNLMPRRPLTSLVTAVLVISFLYGTTVYPNWGRRSWSETFVQSNIAQQILEPGATVYLADHRTSFLVPDLVATGAKVGNLFSQPWFEGSRKGSPIDRAALKVDERTPTYVIQYSPTDYRKTSDYLRSRLRDRVFSCTEIATNFSLAPLLCSYRNENDVPRLALGQEYSHHSPYLRFSEGWSHAEQGHRWSDGHQAIVHLALPTDLPPGCRARLKLRGFTITRQRVAVVICPQTIAEFSLDGPFQVAVDLPDETVITARPIELQLRLPDATPGPQDDPRVLGVALQAVSVECAGAGSLQ